MGTTHRAVQAPITSDEGARLASSYGVVLHPAQSERHAKRLATAWRRGFKDAMAYAPTGEFRFNNFQRPERNAYIEGFMLVCTLRRQGHEPLLLDPVGSTSAL